MKYRLAWTIPFQSSSVQPPRQEGKQRKGAWRQQDEEVGTERCQAAQMASKLNSLSGRPSIAVAWLHQQREQSLNADHLSPNPIAFSAHGRMEAGGKSHTSPFTSELRTGLCAMKKSGYSTF